MNTSFHPALLWQVDVLFEDDGWHSFCPAAHALILEVLTELCRAPALAEDAATEMSVAIALSDNAHVHELNARHRGKDKPTNVLSFPNDDDPFPGEIPHMGDVILALDVVRDEAVAQQKSAEHHLAHLVLHGVLHLLGYDHMNDTEALRMEQLEKDVLARLGVPDPYRVEQETIP